MEKQTVEKQTTPKQVIERQTYAIGDRVEKLCAVCQEERGHVVASITKRGLISRVTCPKCGTRGSFSFRCLELPDLIANRTKAASPNAALVLGQASPGILSSPSLAPH